MILIIENLYILFIKAYPIGTYLPLSKFLSFFLVTSKVIPKPCVNV